ncbi:MAG: nuclear transport factor 2 family protein [Verrucomicrobia bacterium]|nr:nuclear transport factor 2 family protein [Verrucomicrobiota bacterium]
MTKKPCQLKAVGLSLWLLLALLCLSACSEAAHPQKAEIEVFLNRYFNTWSAKDMDGYGSCFHSTARITFVEKGGQCGSQGVTDFLHGQKLGHERSAEAMTEVPTDMKISGDSRVALAEVRWKLTKGREIVTGTDFFTLLKTPDGWRIASLVFYND